MKAKRCKSNFNSPCAYQFLDASKRRQLKGAWIQFDQILTSINMILGASFSIYINLSTKMR